MDTHAREREREGERARARIERFSAGDCALSLNEDAQVFIQATPFPYRCADDQKVLFEFLIRTFTPFRSHLTEDSVDAAIGLGAAVLTCARTTADIYTNGS